MRKKRTKRISDLEILFCPLPVLIGSKPWEQDGYLSFAKKAWWLHGMSVAISRPDVRAWLLTRTLSVTFRDKLITAARMGGWRVTLSATSYAEVEKIERR